MDIKTFEEIYESYQKIENSEQYKLGKLKEEVSEFNKSILSKIEELETLIKK
jgi:hypothetical protein